MKDLQENLRTPNSSRNKEDRNMIRQVRPCEEEKEHVVWNKMNFWYKQRTILKQLKIMSQIDLSSSGKMI